jgi:hypothetical protein
LPPFPTNPHPQLLNPIHSEHPFAKAQPLFCHTPRKSPIPTPLSTTLFFTRLSNTLPLSPHNAIPARECGSKNQQKQKYPAQNQQRPVSAVLFPIAKV